MLIKLVYILAVLLALLSLITGYLGPLLTGLALCLIGILLEYTWDLD